MSDPSVCRVCGLQPNTRNNAVRECAHVECPHRRRCWSERPDPWRDPEPPGPNPIDRLFDSTDG